MSKFSLELEGFSKCLGFAKPLFFGQCWSINALALIGYGGTFFGKREVYFELKGFQPKEYGDDTDFWARAEEAFNVAKITEPPTYIYIRTADSITGKATLHLL